jgi:hypothetical protein
MKELRMTPLAAKCLANNAKYKARNYKRPERKQGIYRNVSNQWGFKRLARVVESADTPDLKSVERKLVRVQVPLRAPSSVNTEGIKSK